MRELGIIRFQPTKVDVMTDSMESVATIEKTQFTEGRAVRYPEEYHTIACQLWADHGVTEQEPAGAGDWLMGGRNSAGVLLGYVRYAECNQPHEIHLAELVVDGLHRGHGVGESLIVAMAQHLLSELPQRTEISTQPFRGDDRTFERQRWFNEFDFWMSAADDETNGIWFASTHRVALGRRPTKT